MKKNLQTSYCLSRSMVSFECPLVRLNEQRNISLFYRNPKTFSHLELIFKRIFVFYAAEGRRLKLRLWGIYFPLTFIISLAFSFGAFMFIRELKTNKELNEIN